MCDEKLLSEIVKIIHKNGDTMLSNNLRKEISLDNVDFIKCISRLVNLGYVRRGHGSQKRTHRYIYLTDEGKELVN